MDFGVTDFDLPGHVIACKRARMSESLSLNMSVTRKENFFWVNIVCQVLSQRCSNEGMHYTLAGGGPGLAG